ncbi:hypothetical protein IFM89_011916 [Coptis chinensis]|uniref:Uncharacterized protein n=1 Tax=Coptis chinensis TaxID=261450 RepID=A0A835I4A4_9MAGN|nr:hypothetical protein IFM89_011916 [Coptis chinensis]
MSALVDIWTREFAKLRENGQSMFPIGSPKLAGAELKSKSSESTSSTPVLARLFQFESSTSEGTYSEDTILMIMECFSP